MSGVEKWLVTQVGVNDTEEGRVAGRVLVALDTQVPTLPGGRLKDHYSLLSTLCRCLQIRSLVRIK